MSLVPGTQEHKQATANVKMYRLCTTDPDTAACCAERTSLLSLFFFSTPVDKGLDLSERRGGRAPEIDAPPSEA